MIRTTGGQAIKHEPSSLVDRLPIDVDQKQSIKLQYRVEQTSDIAQIGRVPGSDITINYPVENAERLGDLKLIESQFAAENKIADPAPDLVDTAIVRAMPYFLDLEGVDVPDDSILAARVRALIFAEARGKYRTDLLDYLGEHVETAQSLGFKTNAQIGGESTLSRTANDWGLTQQPVQNAITRIQHMLSRNGILPGPGADTEYTVNQPIPCDSQLPAGLRCQGLVNYSDLIFRQLSDISLGRGSGVTYTPREIIAGLAQMAIHDNPRKGRQLAQWQYKTDIITIERIQQIVSDNFYRNNILLGKRGIEKLDKKLHQAIFSFADDIGLFRRPIDIALDPTWVPIDSDVATTPGAIANPTISGDTEGGFTYPMAVSFSPIALSLGVKYVTDKSQYPNAFRQLLSRLKQFCDVGWVIADREFDSANMVSLLREVAGQKWIIRVREHHEVITNDVVQSLKQTGKAQVTIGKHNVNVFASDYTAPNHFDLEENENIIILSDMPIGETEPSSLVDIYLKRWWVETYIRQIKHDFSPKMNRDFAPIHQFLFTNASTFYNIWAIINQSVSPMYGLPLQPRYYDVLQGIIQSTYTNRRQVQSQIGESQACE